MVVVFHAEVELCERGWGSVEDFFGRMQSSDYVELAIPCFRFPQHLCGEQNLPDISRHYRWFNCFSVYSYIWKTDDSAIYLLLKGFSLVVNMSKLVTMSLKLAAKQVSTNTLLGAIFRI